MLCSSDVRDRQNGQRWWPCSAVGHWDRSQVHSKMLSSPGKWVQEPSIPEGKVICLYSHSEVSSWEETGDVALGSQTRPSESLCHPWTWQPVVLGPPSDFRRLSSPCPTPCDPWTITHRLSVHGILQGRMLSGVAIPFSRVSS